MADSFLKSIKRKNDFILAAVIILLAAAGLLLSNGLKSEGEYAVIKIDGKEVFKYALSENVRTVISSDEKSENVFVIENGEAFIESANCKDQICVKHKKIKNEGESIICLPHKVVVEITDGINNDGVDVVV